MASGANSNQLDLNLCRGYYLRDLNLRGGSEAAQAEKTTPPQETSKANRLATVLELQDTA
jgi:hypothetical protein